jgi:hypothetical protein
VAAIYALNLLYTRITGSYQFVDSNIPAAVFLGMHLLVTDPATSPRKGLGKIIFGGAYGVLVFASYSLLKQIHAPEFYDKLLCVPPLNLSVRMLDRFSDAVIERLRRTRPLPAWQPKMVNYAWMGVWAGLFAVMTGSGFLIKGNDHPGGHPAFWAKACQNSGSGACETWATVLEASCRENTSDDCVALGNLENEGKYVAKNAAMAGVSYGRACDLGLAKGCDALITFMRDDGLSALMPACDHGDGASCFILGSLFSGGHSVPKNPAIAFELFQKSCRSGWPRGCGRLGLSYIVGEGTEINAELAIANFEKGCRGGNAVSCAQAGEFYRRGKLGVKMDLAQDRFQQACDLGMPAACRQVGVPASDSVLDRRR